MTMLIDEIMPTYQVRKQYTVYIDAPQETVFDTLLNSPKVIDSTIFRTLVRLRELPAVLFGNSEKIFPSQPMPLGHLLECAKFSLLAKNIGQEIVFGVVGRFWDVLNTGMQRVSGVQEFQSFHESAYGKVVMNFFIEPMGNQTKLSTETRVFFPCEKYLRRFKVYWFLIEPFSGLIRKIFLKKIKVEAEMTPGSAP